MRKIILIALILAVGSLALACTNKGGLFGRGVNIGYTVRPACGDAQIQIAIQILEGAIEEDNRTIIRREAWNIWLESLATSDNVLRNLTAAFRKIGYNLELSESITEMNPLNQVFMFKRKSEGNLALVIATTMFENGMPKIILVIWWFR